MRATYYYFRYYIFIKTLNVHDGDHPNIEIYIMFVIIIQQGGDDSRPKYE